MVNQWGTFTFASRPTKMLGGTCPPPSPYNRRPCGGAHRSKPAARSCSGRMGQTDERTDRHRTFT